MTVDELIEKLKAMPQGAETARPGESFDYALINSVELMTEPDLVLDAANANYKIS